MDNKISINVKCKDCNEEFIVSSDKDFITFKKEFNVNGQSIFLTYYDCPKCGRRHFAQIDNNESLEILKDVNRQFSKLMVLRKKDKQIPKGQLVKFEKTRKHLSEVRNNLIKKYTGQLVHDEETNEDFELIFIKL